jgi:hypothetical protein
MKKNTLKLTIILFLFAGSLACTNNNDDIDMSKIDFSNIDDLYKQPLSVIQKCIEGKWKVVYYDGGIAYHVEYFDDRHVEFTAKYQYISNLWRPSGIIDTIPYTWIKGDYFYNGFYLNCDGYGAYGMDRIKNDTLVFFDYASDAFYYHCVKINNN